MIRALVLVALLPLSAAWLASAPGRALPARALRSGRIVLEEETWSFGDAADVSTTTAEAIEGEERELTEKQKEIARLRAAEKFMMKDTGDSVCTTCGFAPRQTTQSPTCTTAAFSLRPPGVGFFAFGFAFVAKCGLSCHVPWTLGPTAPTRLYPIAVLLGVGALLRLRRCFLLWNDEVAGVRTFLRLRFDW